MQFDCQKQFYFKRFSLALKNSFKKKEKRIVEYRKEVFGQSLRFFWFFVVEGLCQVQVPFQTI